MTAQRISLCALLVFASSAAFAGAPIAVDVQVPQTTLVVGEPLVLELRATNVSSEPIAQFGISSSPFSLTFYQGDIVENCTVVIAVPEPVQPVPSLPPLFRFSWRLPGLRPGETANCRITYTQTLNPGQEIIRFSSVIDGVIWHDLAEFTYTLQGAPAQPAEPVPLHPPTLLCLFAATLVLLALGRLRS